MDSEEFRRHAHAFVDWMADYMDAVERLPVRAQVHPGEIAARLPDEAPQIGEDMGRIFADFVDQVMPGITHWQHPSFFAYFPANSSPPSVLAEMLTATLGAQCMLWQTSPAATEMETKILGWLRRMIGLPDSFHGVIQDSASSATLCALLTAREKATDWRANEDGLAAQSRLAFYVSEEAHSSVEKDVRVAGFGSRSLRKIATDDALAMDPAALEAAITEDIAAGIKPACVVATPRHHRNRRRRPPGGDRGSLRAPRRLASRRCRLGRQRPHFAGASFDDRWHRTRRQFRLQSAQMVADELRLFGLFRARPRGFGAHAFDPARVP